MNWITRKNLVTGLTISRLLLATTAIIFSSCKANLAVTKPTKAAAKLPASNVLAVAKSQENTLSQGKNLTYNSSLFYLDSEGLKLKTAGLSDVSYTSDGFQSGTLTGATWDSTIGGLTITNGSVPEFPDNKSSTGWFDASSMAFLAHFNDASIVNGGTVVESANGGTGTFTAGTGANRAGTGKMSGALAFSGGTDKVNFGNVADFEKTDSFSISLWLKPSNQGSARDVFCKCLPGTLQGYRMYLGPNNDLVFQIEEDNGTSKIFFWGSNFLTANQWYHIAVTYDGSSTIAGIKFYVDAVLDATPQGTSNNLVGSIKGGGNLVFGDFGTASAMGSLDEVAIFSKELSATEVRTIYDRQKFAFGGYFDSRVGDGKSATTWTDLSWVPYAPYAVELPANAQSESVYTAGNADMTSNVFNLNMNGTSLATNTNTSGKGSTTPTTSGAGPTYSYPGIIGDAIRFADTAGQELSFAHHADYNSSTALTVSLWVKRKGASHHGAMISKGNEFSLAYDETNDTVLWCLQTTTHACPGYPFFTASAISLPVNQWTHLALRFDQSAGFITIFKNGTSVLSIADAGTLVTNANPILVGSDLSSHTEGLIDAVSIFTRALSDTEILDQYKRGALKISFQVRSCPTIDCAGKTFVGPSASSAQFLNATSLSSLILPSYSLSGIVSANRYFQYRATFETLNTIAELPYLKSVTVLPPRYDVNSPSANIASLTFTTLSAFKTTQTGNITYALSIDGGTTQYYWNGSKWSKGGNTVTDSNSAATVNTNISSFPTDVGTGTLTVVAYFTSDGSTSPVLSYLKVDGAI